MIKNPIKARLILADGRVYEGISFGCTGSALGEVVFTTGAVGYQESLTDPSHYGQLVAFTFPLMGNYGINREDSSSEHFAVAGCIVREWCEVPSNFCLEEDLHSFLKRRGVVGICDIDTRALTRHLRDHGPMKGLITTEALSVQEALSQIEAFHIQDAVAAVTCRTVTRHSAPEPRYTVGLYDLGHNRRTLGWLMDMGCRVILLPAGTPPEDIAALDLDGLVLSEGPGDPADNPDIVADIGRMAAMRALPMLGIGLGHQLMALSAGGCTVRMPRGHRGSNQPVADLATGQIFITAQNHGYQAVPHSLPAEVAVLSHQNVNDQSCEGLRYLTHPWLSVQFRPESFTAPGGTNRVFLEFAALMDGIKEGK